MISRSGPTSGRVCAGVIAGALVVVAFTLPTSPKPATDCLGGGASPVSPALRLPAGRVALQHARGVPVDRPW